MKVFQVKSEYCKKNSTEIKEMIRYVTSEEDTLESVVKFFTKHCEYYEEELIGVQMVLLTVQHITDETLFENITKP